MPDEITITQRSASSSEQAPQNITLSRAQMVNLCAIGLGISFFLPWAQFWGGTLSGFELQKLGDEQRVLWLIPILCAFTVFTGATKRNQKVVGPLTGVLPFAVGAYWLYKLGSDLTKLLAYGAYLSLAFGAALFILSRKSK